MTLFEALTGGAFDRLNWQHSGEFDQNFSQKSNDPVFARGEGKGGFGNDRYINGRKKGRRQKLFARKDGGNCRTRANTLPLANS